MPIVSTTGSCACSPFLHLPRLLGGTKTALPPGAGAIFPTCAFALCQEAATPPHLPHPNGHHRLRRLPIAVSPSTTTLRTCTLGPMPPSTPRAAELAITWAQARTCTCISSGPHTLTPWTGYSTWPSSASPDRLTTLGEPLSPRLAPPPTPPPPPRGGVLDQPLAAPRPPPPSSVTNDGLRFTSPAVRPGQS